MKSIAEHILIAVDGPSGSGKSTVAKKIAGALGIEYIDTGAMYRMVALKFDREGVTSSDPSEQIEKVLETTATDFSEGCPLLDGKDVSRAIRTPKITKLASEFSALRTVREKLVRQQREIGAVKSVIMDGRDIGSNVFPDATYKFYVTASAEERARRRYLELSGRGASGSYEEVLDAIRERDANDESRILNPLVIAKGAIVVDTDNLSADETVAYILDKINERGE